MKTVKTVCPRDCYDTCSLIVTVGDDGKIESISGDPSNPFTRGFTCPRGKKDITRLYNGRVLYPHIRTGDKPGRSFKKTGWPEALDLIADKLVNTLDTHGEGSVLLLDFAGYGGLLSMMYSHRLWNSIAATQTDSAICSNSGHTGLELHYGQSYGLQPDELAGTDLIVFWGFNAPVSSPHMWSLALEARKQKSAKIMVIDPRESECAKGADLRAAPRPGSDVALAMGVCRHLIETECFDAVFIEKRTSGFEKLKKEVSHWTPEKVSEATGLTPAEVLRIGQSYADSKKSATMIGIGLQKNKGGADMVRAVSFIPALKGLPRGFLYTNGRAYSVDSEYLNGESLCSRPGERTSQVALGERLKRADFKFIYIYSTNPAVVLPGQKDVREGLEHEDVFTVVHETHWTETSDRADVVLPATSFLEKRDIVLPWSHRHVRLSEKVIEPLGESRDETWVMQELAGRLGLEESWLYEDPWRALERAFEGALDDGTFEDLTGGRDLLLKPKPREEYRTPSGKLEFYSGIALTKGLNPLPQHQPPVPGPGEFFLLNTSTRHYTNTQFRAEYGPIPAEVTMNPADADTTGVAAGETVSLTNELGCIDLVVKLSESVPMGVLWAPRQLTDLAGRPMNDITSPDPQPVGGGPTFNSTIVTVIKK